MKRLLLLTAIISLLFTACDDNSTDPKNNKVIVPLKIGNTWIYKITSFDSLGKITDTKMDTLSVEKDTVFKGESMFIIQERQSGWKSPLRIGAVNRSNGFYYIVFNSTSPDWYFYNYPAKIGEFFQYNEEITTLVSTDTLISHLATGTYHCFKYSKVANYGDSYNNNVMFAVPDVGTVYSEFYYSYQNGKKYLDSKHELVSLILK